MSSSLNIRMVCILGLALSWSALGAGKCPEIAGRYSCDAEVGPYGPGLELQQKLPPDERGRSNTIYTILPGSLPETHRTGDIRVTDGRVHSAGKGVWEGIPMKFSYQATCQEISAVKTLLLDEITEMSGQTNRGPGAMKSVRSYVFTPDVNGSLSITLTETASASGGAAGSDDLPAPKSTKVSCKKEGGL